MPIHTNHLTTTEQQKRVRSEKVKMPHFQAAEVIWSPPENPGLLLDHFYANFTLKSSQYSKYVIVK